MIKELLSTLKLVYGSLLARKGRSFLTILGIVIGVAGVITIIALGAGAQVLVLGQVTKLGSNLLSVQPGKSNEKGPPAQIFGIVVTTLTYEDGEAVRDTSRVPHAVSVNSIVRGSGTVIWGNSDLDTTFVATEYTYPQVVDITMQSGRFFDEKEDRGNANVVVLGSYVAEELFGRNGVDPIGQIMKVKVVSQAEGNTKLNSSGGVGVPLRVVGVIAPRGSAFFQNQDDQIYIPLEIGQKQLLGIRHIQALNVKIDSSDHVDQSREDIKQLLNERHRIKKEADADFTVRSIADAAEILSTITNALKLFLTAMAAVSLVVGGIGILNVMLVTVAERTREIGLRKAVGAKSAAILYQFLFESSILTLLGGIIGIIVGIIVSFLVAQLMQYLGYDWAFIISWWSLIIAVGVSVLTGIVFGLYPAFKASKLNPIDALRYE